MGHFVRALRGNLFEYYDPAAGCGQEQCTRPKLVFGTPGFSHAHSCRCAPEPNIRALSVRLNLFAMCRSKFIMAPAQGCHSSTTACCGRQKSTSGNILVSPLRGYYHRRASWLLPRPSNSGLKVPSCKALCACLFECYDGCHSQRNRVLRSSKLHQRRHLMIPTG